MDNATRKALIARKNQSGFPGSIIDVFRAYDQGVDLIGQFEQQQMQVARTQQEQQQGLRPAHQAGNVNASMAFPNQPPNASFNTVGMKAPINLKQYDPRGNLVKSYEAVPPGVTDLKMSSQGGTVIETPAQMQFGGLKPGPRVPEMSDAEMSLKIIQEANAGNPAARRMRSDYGQRMFLPGETDPSTHYMASFDNYAVPTVQEDYIGGPLSYNPNPAPSKADFRFNTPEQAAYFAKNYKQASAAKSFQQKNGGVRKYQTGDFWNPVSIANYMAETKGGEPERFYNFADSAAYHESWHTMDPRMLQKPGEGRTIEDMEKIGGKGTYQIESRSLPTYWQRMQNLSARTNIPLPNWYNENETDARNLTYDQQKVLFMVNMLEHEDTNTGAYGRGQATSADQWAKGWKETYDDADIRAFETSMAKARREGITLPKGAQPWPSTPAQQPVVAQEAKQDSTKEEVPFYLEMWNTLKSYLDYKKGGVVRYQTGGPSKLIEFNGSLISVPLNATQEEIQAIYDKQNSAPKETPKPKPAPAPVTEEPDVIPTTGTRPSTTPPRTTTPGSLAPSQRNRVNYDDGKTTRALRRDVNIYEGAPSKEGWYNADDIAARNASLSQLPYEQMIAASRAIYRPEDMYFLSDNEKGTYGVYQGGRLVAEYEGLSGRNAGDAITVVPHVKGKPDYSAGNLTSGAGEYFLSNASATSNDKYNNAPSFNFALPNGVEQAMTIHGTPAGRLQYFENKNADDNRQTYGCINGLCGDLREIFGMNVPLGSSWYSLPEDAGNSFKIIDGMPYLSTSPDAMAEAQSYTDAYGRTQKGQGMNTINRTKPEYREIRANIDMEAFERDIFNESEPGVMGWLENTFTGDTTDREEFEQTTQPYVNSLVDNKQKIMQATGISNDQYNLIAKVAFGILGTESSFGDTNSAANNLVRGAAKAMELTETNMDTASEHALFTELLPALNAEARAMPPDIYSMSLASATDKDPENYSLGPTQLRWNSLVRRDKNGKIVDTTERDFVESLGVTGPEQLNDPETAALVTAALLAHRLNNRKATLNATNEEELTRALAEAWNPRKGYADNVIKNSQYLTIQQRDRMKLGGARPVSKYFKKKIKRK